MFQRLSLALAQVKAGNTSENLPNVCYSKVYNSFEILKYQKKEISPIVIEFNSDRIQNWIPYL